MASRDIHSNLKTSKALSITAIGSDTNTDGDEIDMSGHESVMFAILSGTLTDGTYTPAILESDTSGSGYAAAAAGDLIGTVANATFAATADNAVKKLGYKGNKRYVKLRITSASTTTGGTIGAVCLQGHADINPVA